MRYPVILEERAIQEADEAYKYYEGELAGLGDRFKEELQKAILYIQEHPLHFKKIKEEIRQALIHRFPYLIV